MSVCVFLVGVCMKEPGGPVLFACVSVPGGVCGHLVHMNLGGRVCKSAKLASLCICVSIYFYLCKCIYRDDLIHLFVFI